MTIEDLKKELEKRISEIDKNHRLYDYEYESGKRTAYESVLYLLEEN